MSWLEAALTETAEYPHPDTLDAFRASIDPAWIDEALQYTGTATLRRRRLPADQVIWLVLGMAMIRNRPIDDVVAKLDLAMPGKGNAPVVKSAVSQARARLGEEPMEWLFKRCSRQWATASAERNTWHGLALYAIDGTSLRVADSEANRDHFGRATGSRGDSGYPMARLTALMALRSHLIVDARFGPFAESEKAQAAKLWPAIPGHSVTIFDRNYYDTHLLCGMEHGAEERHWLQRAKSDIRWKELESFGRYDKLVRLNVSDRARKLNPDLPRSYDVRAISYRHPRSNGRQWLITSLRDPKQYPAKELVALYHERWEIELGYDEIKTHMLDRPRQEMVRSRKVETARQEIWGILLAYNLVRLEMERIAAEAGVSPSRISFLMALRYIRDEWAWCAVASPGSIPTKLRRMREQVSRFVLPERRPERHYERAVKIKMSNFKKKRGKAQSRTRK